MLDCAQSDVALAPDLVNMPLFGKSAADRYQDVAPTLTRAFYDDATWEILQAAARSMDGYCARTLRFRPGGEPLCGREVGRLVLDGYVLGRIEARTEKADLTLQLAGLSEPERQTLDTACLGAITQLSTDGQQVTYRPTAEILA
jgi:hypothetical protein